jgi:hypothetical protein
VRRVAFALVAIAIVGGTVLDRPAPKPEIRRGEWRVLEADLHAHTRFSDGFLSPFDLVIQGRRRGLDVLAVTEHNSVFPGKMARFWSGVVDGPTILVGEEVTTNRFHLHGIGIESRIDPSQSVAGVIKDIHAQGGIAIAAHPVKRYWKTFVPVEKELDGAEVMHPIAFGQQRGGWRWDEMRDFYVNAQKGGAHLTAVASSDYHFFSPLGVCRTLVFAKSGAAPDVLEALKNGRTVVHDLEGNAYGDPKMIELLQKEPYPNGLHDYDYQGSGLPDRVLRTLGWLGLLGVILFRNALGTRKKEAKK